MPKTVVKTDQAARLAKRLTNHFRHKVEIIENETNYLVKMSGADVTLTPNDSELIMEYIRNESTDNPERPFDEDKLRFVLTDHLNRMADQTFEYNWQ